MLLLWQLGWAATAATQAFCTAHAGGRTMLVKKTTALLLKNNDIHI
jgi:hypothetical protein